MDNDDRLQLNKLLKEYQSEETTSKIRELKHSSKIRQDVTRIQHLKNKYSRIYKNNFSQFKRIAISNANFLYSHYTNLFNRILKGELDLNTLWQFLKVLEQIENGKIDQHDGSYIVGNLLKKMYIDSALEKEKKRKDKTNVYKKIAHKLSWSDYKKMNLE